MILRIILGWVVTGAIIGFLYSWNRLAPDSKRAIDVILSVPIAHDDKSMRKKRAESIGYIKGLRLGGSAVIAAIGAAIGLILGLITSAIMWIVG